MRTTWCVGAVLSLVLLAGCQSQVAAPDEETTVAPPPTDPVPAPTTSRPDPDEDGFDASIDFCPDEPGPVNGCPDEDSDGIADTLQTSTSSIPGVGATSSSLPVRPSSTPPTTDSGREPALRDTFFAADAGQVVSDLEAAEFVVIDYRVCSGSVASGEVRQIIRSSDGAVLLDKEGVTAAGLALAAGTVIEVKVGTGSPCG